ncbi:sterol desaturase family protein [Gordonia sp. HY285]|uniref:sterol desaturase family protein n=1 Tax=Gordonia liuliyuniae TaxID=2911517 RepID=UPI001F1AE3FC|nr:sterol desaturase family protein [Gordonia liuliyuniae]MCF8609070.1 sterol desaturase family protein [Gordonia liuliyuniae]
MLDSIPEQLREPTVLAIPFFALMLGLELFAAARLEQSHDDDGRPRPGAYRREDAKASILMGVVSIGTSAVGKFLALFVYAALFAYVAPWQLPIGSWYTWVIGFVGLDFLFYWEHRIAHRVRLVWASHQAHHSSEYYNFATALRQKWNPTMSLIMWLPLPLLGVPPAVVFACYSLNLIYQFWVHTEHIGTMWRPFEFVMNTPSHHRVHHGSDPEYLDRNYGGVFIVFDRIFGSFRPETHRPTYGLTKPVGTHNIWTLETHEYVSVFRDVRSAPTIRAKLGYVFGPPGWAPRATERADRSPLSHSSGAPR